MSLPPLSQLLEAQSAAQIEATLVAFLKNPGNGLPPLPATSWGATSYGPYLVNSEALVLSQVYQSVINMTMGGYFQLAASPLLVDPTTGTSPWVDYLAQQFYNQTRLPSQATEGPFVFTTAATAGPYTIAAGQLQILAATGAIYTNVSGFTIPGNGSIPATVMATTPGSSGNIANGTALSLVTALPGVTVTTYPSTGSPPWYTVPYTDTNIAQAGSDLESDASLTARCLNQWVAMGTGSPIGAWINWAYAASNEVRFALPVPTGLGSVNLYVYGSGGAVSTPGLIAIQAYVASRLPLCSFIAPGSTMVSGAIPNQGMPLNAVPLYINQSSISTIKATISGPQISAQAGLAAAAAALQLLVQTTPVGGVPIAPGTPDTCGISNAAFTSAIKSSNSAISNVVVQIDNGFGFSRDNDLIFLPSGGVPRIAQPPPNPSAPASWGLTWQPL